MFLDLVERIAELHGEVGVARQHPAKTATRTEPRHDDPQRHASIAANATRCVEDTCGAPESGRCQVGVDRLPVGVVGIDDDGVGGAVREVDAGVGARDESVQASTESPAGFSITMWPAASWRWSLVSHLRDALSLPTVFDRFKFIL